MLMAAGAPHMGGSAHSSSSSISPPPSWHPAVLVPNHHHHPLYDDLDLTTPSRSPTTPAATASPPRPRHGHSLRPASRQRAGKQRRPRPSRKLPTTYISADAASFRRMVHQVTGADDVPLPPLSGPAAQAPELLRHQAPAPHSRAGLTTTTTTTETLLLPTLDTSAFLVLGTAARGGRGRGGAASARPGVSCDHGLQVKAGGGGGGCGFRSLESWDDDDDDALF